MLAERIRECAKLAGSGNALAERSGIARTTLENYLNGRSEPKAGALVSMAKAAGVRVEWLASGGGPMLIGCTDTPETTSDISAYRDFSLIRRLSVEASAGYGALSGPEDHDNDAGMLAFQSDWLHRHGINPRAARALTAKGDSMEPTIRDGDILLVDTSIDRVRDNAIYVVVLGGLVLVKRLQVRRDGSLRLISDNDRFEPEEVPANEATDIQVAGRVMWYGRSI